MSSNVAVWVVEKPKCKSSSVTGRFGNQLSESLQLPEVELPPVQISVAVERWQYPPISVPASRTARQRGTQPMVLWFFNVSPPFGRYVVLRSNVRRRR